MQGPHEGCDGGEEALARPRRHGVRGRAGPRRRALSAPPGGVQAPLGFPVVNRLCMAVFYGRAAA
jgi:hypothetical protein